MLLDLRSLVEASAGFVYSASGGALFGGQATVVVPVREEAARGWRYHAHAQAAGAGAPAAAARIRIRADAIGTAAGVMAAGGTGQVVGRGATALRLVRAGAGATVGRAQASGAAAHAQIGVAVAAGLRAAAGASSARSVAQPLATFGHAGEAAVTIGPDLIEQEFEEIMFLLEVA